MNRPSYLSPVVLFGLLSACAPNAKETKATVVYIDRECQIITTKYDENFKPTDHETRTDSCNSIAEWDKVREKRNKVVDGTAVVHVSYMVPQTGQPGTGELKFDGRDDEFYNLKAGDDIAILVSDADPARIQKA
ncbi:MAG: hypothetical protein JOZ20_06865 [Sphingomonas sp.]|nr:hypothetical protein [Sphingomonas sp.]MBW0008455.1 hypothetical protein [Sphingomonas sp.]